MNNAGSAVKAQPTPAPVALQKLKTLVPEFQRLRAESKLLKAQSDEVRDEIRGLVDTHGDWDGGELGSAKFVPVGPSISFDTKAIGALVESWLGSDDPIMRSCGDMLAQHRTERPASQRLMVE